MHKTQIFFWWVCISFLRGVKTLSIWCVPVIGVKSCQKGSVKISTIARTSIDHYLNGSIVLRVKRYCYQFLLPFKFMKKGDVSRRVDYPCRFSIALSTVRRFVSIHRLLFSIMRSLLKICQGILTCQRNYGSIFGATFWYYGMVLSFLDYSDDLKGV